MEAEEAVVTRALLDDLNELALINETLKPVEARKRILTERVKQGMGLRGLDELADGETGVVAKIQERNAAPLYDLVRVSHQSAPSIISAARAGMLRLDHAMFDRFQKANGAEWCEAIERAQMPGAQTTALIIEKRDA